MRGPRNLVTTVAIIALVALLVVVAVHIITDCANGARAERALPDRPPQYLRWAQQAKWNRLDGDTVKATRYAAALYRVDPEHLLACIESEGGQGSRDGRRPGWHEMRSGLWFPTGAAGEIGPAQILSPSHPLGWRAWEDVSHHRSDVRLPPKRYVVDRYSVLGQTVVLAWGLLGPGKGTSGAAWFGAGC